MIITDLEIKTFVNSDFEENLYVVWLKDSKDCIAVDPGFDPREAIEFIKKEGMTPRGILVTHAHLDHVAGLAAMKKEWPAAEILIGEKERSKLGDPNGNLSAFFGCPMAAADADRTLADGEQFEVAGIPMTALLCPGHSSGHMVYRIDGEDGFAVFVGDVVFAGSVGRTDFPGGSTEQLLASIRKHLLTLPDPTAFYSGHGPKTTVGREKVSNLWF